MLTRTPDFAVSETRLKIFSTFPYTGDRPVARPKHTKGKINTERRQMYIHDRREIRNHDPSAGAIGGKTRQKTCSHFVHNLTVLFSTISKRTNTRQFSVPSCHYKYFLAFLVKQIPRLSPHPRSESISTFSSALLPFQYNWLLAKFA
jgi:hypothetical protein